MKRKESQNPLKTTYQHDESTPFGVLFYDLDSENMAACGHLLGLVPPLAPTGSSGLICRSPERGCLDCQRFPFPLSSRGWFVLSSMLDAEEQGAQRPEENTVMLRRSIPHYTLLRKVVRQARHLCAQSAALMCLMGIPHTPLYARRTVRTLRP